MTNKKSKSNNSKKSIPSSNQVFTPNLINKINRKREWTGGVVVKQTIFD